MIAIRASCRLAATRNRGGSAMPESSLARPPRRFWIIGLVALGFHLLHGFQSAFQTLGLRHKKYTPIIEVIGVVYTVLVTVGFAVLPIYMYFN